jgi:hypothetical protein
MRIGSSENSLLIEKLGSPGERSRWRFAAEVIGPGWMFAGFDEMVQINPSEDTKKGLADFLALKEPRIELLFSEDGWLRISRRAGGHILLRYRVARLKVGASIQGEVVVPPESAEVFCRQLGELL